jgi:arabinofuranosyltransferase
LNNILFALRMNTFLFRRSEFTHVTPIWIVIACACIGYAFVRTAAVTEDAFITFRVIDNAINRYGLVWNVGERVQPYTHPLWALLLLVFASITGELYHTALALSLALTLTTVALIARYAVGRITLLWAIVALLFSEAFIEYSSASLENALAHALIVAAVVAWRWMPERPLLFALCAGLLAITRHDLGVLVAPALAWLFFRSSGVTRWKLFAVAAAPLALWSAFALLYYGSMWPNSAYAKLNNGMTLAESFAASMPYFRDLAKYDAVTALFIVVACVRGLIQKSWQMRALALGLSLYLVYLCTVGGDYMGGRLFSVPFAMAVSMLAFSVRLRWWWTAPVWFAVTIALGLQRGWLVRDVHPHAEPRKLSQHAWMYPHSGWLAPNRADRFNRMPWAAQGEVARREAHRVTAKCAVGLYGFTAGPAVYIVDPLALTDNFLSRLPSKKPAYPGHYERALPSGYVESKTNTTNRLSDPSLAALYALTQKIASAPLLDAERLEAIWAINTGEARRLVSRASYNANAIALPGHSIESREPLACLGRLDPLFTARLK